jgi:hypothetical protein
MQPKDKVAIVTGSGRGIGAGIAEALANEGAILVVTLRCALLATVLFSMAGCAPSPINKPINVGPAEKGPGTVTAARKFLEGRWSLESFEFYPPGKPKVTVTGQGVLTYDDFSNLKIDIRADQAASDLLRASGIDIGSDGIISSDGRTALDLQNKTLTYVVQGQPVGSGPLAVNRPRHWEVDGNVLTLTTKDDAGKPTSVGRWKKS